MGPGCVKTRTTGRQSINFSRFSAVFRHYKLGEAKKFASDATFSDNFRVFTQPGSLGDASVDQCRHIGPQEKIDKFRRSGFVKKTSNQIAHCTRSIGLSGKGDLGAGLNSVGIAQPGHDCGDVPRRNDVSIPSSIAGESGGRFARAIRAKTT
jgi:hypothetical protein